MDVLIAALRPGRPGASFDDARLEPLLSLAARHKVSGAFSHAVLNTPGAGAVARARCAALFQQKCISDLRLAARLLAVLQMLDGNGIAAIPFKGPALAAEYYGDISLRDYGDLDLLLPYPAVFNAAGMLERAGFTPEQPVAEALRPAWLHWSSEYNLAAPGAEFTLELHWKLTPRQLAIHDSYSELAASPGWTELCGKKVLTLKPEMQLLALCIHAYKHEWESLLWLLDIHKVANTPGFAWASFWRAAGQMHVLNLAAVSLLIADELFGVPFAAKEHRSMRQPHARHSAMAYVARLKDGDASGGGTFARASRTANARERITDRVRFLWNNLTMPEGEGAQSFASAEAEVWKMRLGRVRKVLLRAAR